MQIGGYGLAIGNKIYFEESYTSPWKNNENSQKYENRNFSLKKKIRLNFLLN